MRSILITGCNGFIGRAFWQFCERTMPAVTLYGVDLHGGDERRVAMDLSDGQALLEWLEAHKPDNIVHLAGGRTFDDQQDFQRNFLVTKSLLESVARIDGYSPRVIVPGTAAEYGAIPTETCNVSETFPSRPLSYYGLVKFMQTQLALYFALKGVDVLVARMFNILGSGTPAALVAGKFASEIRRVRQEGDAIIHTGPLDGKRDFLDIEDICAAFVALLETGRAGEIYNVCSGKAVAIRDLMAVMLSVADMRNVHVEENQSYSSGSFDCVGDNAKLRQETGWQPMVSLEEAARRTLSLDAPGAIRAELGSE